MATSLISMPKVSYPCSLNNANGGNAPPAPQSNMFFLIPVHYNKVEM